MGELLLLAPSVLDLEGLFCDGDDDDGDTVGVEGVSLFAGSALGELFKLFDAVGV